MLGNVDEETGVPRGEAIEDPCSRVGGASSGVNSSQPSIQSQTPARIPTHMTRIRPASLSRARCQRPAFGGAAGVETSALMVGTLDGI